MNIDKLINLIKEEVRITLREELKDLLNEAVEYASRPSSGNPPHLQKGTVKGSNKIFIDTPQSKKSTSFNSNPIASLLEETKRAMNSADFKEFGNFSTPQDIQGDSYTPSSVGLDISNLDFVKKAKSILNATNSKK